MPQLWPLSSRLCHLARCLLLCRLKRHTQRLRLRKPLKLNTKLLDNKPLWRKLPWWHRHRHKHSTLLLKHRLIEIHLLLRLLLKLRLRLVQVLRLLQTPLLPTLLTRTPLVFRHTWFTTFTIHTRHTVSNDAMRARGAPTTLNEES